MHPSNHTIKQYSERAEEFTATYESLTFEQVHQQLLDLMPEKGSAVLDIGAGSGRDAAWFAQRGCDVVAVEPAQGMIEKAREIHTELQINWVRDGLPDLTETIKLGMSFDLILLSAVWMHIKPNEKPRAFRKLAALLRPGGRLIISLRTGSFNDGRESYPVALSELEKLARDRGLVLVRICQSDDLRNRTDVSWQTVCFQLPDDGTDALPLLRHIIINDSKSSTYKLALLRVLVRIADSATGMAKHGADENVSIPLGLVALYWLRAYKQLIESGIPQRPFDKSQKGLGFVGQAFRNLRHLSPYDLRVGATFTGIDAANLHQALIDAKETIRKMPTQYITYPNSSEQIFKTSGGRPLKSNTYTLNESYLATLGELTVPKALWNSMSRFASWIEPALVGEWIRLMQQYSLTAGREITYDQLMQALVWLDPERDTQVVRKISDAILKLEKPLVCVWSGQRLKLGNYDIDHCFPFAAWPCGDLWNLLPSDRKINQKEKRDKLVSAKSLDIAKERMLEWWHMAFLEESDVNLQRRFVSEAAAALPMQNAESFGTLSNAMPGTVSSAIFNGVAIKRATLKSNLQLDDWDC
ncbi:MAG: class I SAM-dependent methyltransferase [Candidatus Obscuribacterales bacterium]